MVAGYFGRVSIHSDRGGFLGSGCAQVIFMNMLTIWVIINETGQTAGNTDHILDFHSKDDDDINNVDQGGFWGIQELTSWCHCTTLMDDDPKEN